MDYKWESGLEENDTKIRKSVAKYNNIHKDDAADDDEEYGKDEGDKENKESLSEKLIPGSKDRGVLKEEDIIKLAIQNDNEEEKAKENGKRENCTVHNNQAQKDTEEENKKKTESEYEIDYEEYYPLEDYYVDDRDKGDKENKNKLSHEINNEKKKGQGDETKAQDHFDGQNITGEEEELQIVGKKDAENEDDKKMKEEKNDKTKREEEQETDKKSIKVNKYDL